MSEEKRQEAPEPESGGDSSEAEATAEESREHGGSRSAAGEDTAPGDASADGDSLVSEAEDEGEYAEETRELLQELDEVKDRHLRLAAEFENYRKRTRRELSETRERAQAELTSRLLDALDDLSRVVDAVEEEKQAEGDEDGANAGALREGVELAFRKLMKELSEAGLSRIEALGEPFDPELHDALLTTPAEDPEEDEIVSRVLIRGYRFHDRVIRPARVEVKKYRSTASSADRTDAS